jgi:hypothetical protein
MDDAGATTPSRLVMLSMVAACCIAPMLLIILLTTVAGLTIGLSAALALGVVAAALCVGLMVMRHRGHGAEPVRER